MEDQYYIHMLGSFDLEELFLSSRSDNGDVEYVHVLRWCRKAFERRMASERAARQGKTRTGRRTVQWLGLHQQEQDSDWIKLYLRNWMKAI